MRDGIKCSLTGAAAGIANGFFGAGGGMLLIPLLTRWVGLDERKAFASSIFIILPMCAASAVVYWIRVGLDFYAMLPYLAGGLIGGIIGGVVFKKVPVKLLRRALGLLIIYGGVRSLMS